MTINQYINQLETIDTIELDDVSEPIVVTDKSGNIVNISKALLDLTGFTKTELLGQSCSIFSNASTPHFLYEQLWKTITHGDKWQGNLINCKKSGQPYIAEVSIYPIKSSHFEGYYSIQKDVTKLFTQSQISHNHRSIFSAILNTRSLSLVMLDQEFNITYSSRGLKDNIDEIFFYKTLYPQIVEELKALGDKIWQSSQHLELDIETHHQYRSFHCSVDPLTLQESKADCYFEPSTEPHIILVINERTEKRRLLEAQRISAMQLLIADRKHVHSMQEVLMGTIHQLKGPLNMIQSAVKIMNGRNHRCQGLELMSQAVDEGFDALQYIQDHIPERNVESMQVTNLNEVIRDACSISSQNLVSHYIKLDLFLERELPAINAIPSRLILALVQLIENAIEQIEVAKPSERVIAISSCVDGDSVMLKVEDSGLGVSPNNRNKIFEPFYSSKPTYKAGCHGLGLSIVQQVVNDHASIITVEQSSAYSGAKFVIALPIDNEGAGL